MPMETADLYGDRISKRIPLYNGDEKFSRYVMVANGADEIDICH